MAEMEGFEPPHALRRLADFESAPFSHLGTSPKTWLLYQQKKEKSRFFLGAGLLFRQLQNQLHLTADGFVLFPAVGTQAATAILDAVLCILKFTAAFIPQGIQGAITENTAEGFGISTFMARKILALLVLKKIIMTHNFTHFLLFISHFLCYIVAEVSKMKILIDADGCPVVDITHHLAQQYSIPCLILCDTAHFYQRTGAETLIFDKGADSVDFSLVNRVAPGDIVITQDYGLASMCLSRRARVLHQDGWEYTADNMDALLLVRHESRKHRAAGGRMKGTPKRNAAQNEAFEKGLAALLQTSVQG